MMWIITRPSEIRSSPAMPLANCVGKVKPGRWATTGATRSVFSATNWASWSESGAPEK
jgi:hypothetical protein